MSGCFLLGFQCGSKHNIFLTSFEVIIQNGFNIFVYKNIALFDDNVLLHRTDLLKQRRENVRDVIWQVLKSGNLQTKNVGFRFEVRSLDFFLFDDFKAAFVYY